MTNPQRVPLFQRTKEIGTRLTDEKRAELLSILGGDDNLLQELLDKAATRVAASSASAGSTRIKADGEIEVSLEPAADPAMAMEETDQAIADDTAAEEDDRLLTDAEIDLIADRVTQKIMARFDEISSRLSDMDSELKSRGYARAKDDTETDEDVIVVDPADILRRLKSVEESLANLTEEDLPTSVLQVLSRRQPAGIQLKDDEAEQIIDTGRVDMRTMKGVENFFFGPA